MDKKSKSRGKVEVLGIFGIQEVDIDDCLLVDIKINGHKIPDCKLKDLEKMVLKTLKIK